MSQIQPQEALEEFDQIEEMISKGALDGAGERLEQLSYDDLSADLALMAHAYALQIGVAEERYVDAMHHGEALLEAGVDEPFVYHFTGQALWNTGKERAGAEALVRAAEQLRAGDEGFDLPVNPAAVYYMAAEACVWFEQYRSGLEFYRAAEEKAPDQPLIKEAIKKVEDFV